jgi:hypothetical protein
VGCRWIPKVSYLNYAYVAVMKNELYGLQLTDPSDGSRVMAQSLFPQASDNGCVPGRLALDCGMGGGGTECAV